MKSYLERNKDFLQFFHRLTPKQRNAILPNLSGNHINTIAEIFRNFLNKNLTHDKKVIRKVQHCKNEIRAVALKQTPHYKKKQILQSRRGGAILSVLLPLAAGLISSLITRR